MKFYALIVHTVCLSPFSYAVFRNRNRNINIWYVMCTWFCSVYLRQQFLVPIKSCLPEYSELLPWKYSLFHNYNHRVLSHMLLISGQTMLLGSHLNVSINYHIFRNHLWSHSDMLTKITNVTDIYFFLIINIQTTLFQLHQVHHKSC